MQIESAYVKATGAYGQDYLDRLVQRVLVVTSQALQRPDVRLAAILVSGLQTEEEKKEEAAHFFPALRRIGISKELRNDVSKAHELLNIIRSVVKSHSFREFAQRVSPQREPRFLMPIRNSCYPAMENHFLTVYRMESDSLSRRLERDIVKLRGKRAYRVKGVDFSVAVNNGKHPIRRCTETPACDLRALMRFGVVAPERLEFDVSRENGLQGRSFHLCSGEVVKVPTGTSHLNMRMNDDFECA
jgi:hypothetical protein